MSANLQVSRIPSGEYPYVIVEWKDGKVHGVIRKQGWVNGWRKFPTEADAMAHLLEYSKAYAEEQPGIEFSIINILTASDELEALKRIDADGCS